MKHVGQNRRLDGLEGADSQTLSDCETPLGERAAMRTRRELPCDRQAAAALLRTGLADLQEARWIYYSQKAGIPIGGCQRAVYCEPLSGEEIVAEL